MLPRSTPDRVMDCLKGSLTSNACGEICQQSYLFAGSYSVVVYLNN